MAECCDLCGRSYQTQEALQQHLVSPAHNLDCDKCEERFDTKQAQRQHKVSLGHNLDCDKCKKKHFTDKQALQNHKDSPAHNLDCNKCDECFDSKKALQEHLNSPKHNLHCDKSDECFGSKQARQHQLNSPVPAPNFDYDECDKCFGSKQALQNHTDSSVPAHKFDCDECDKCFGSKQEFQQHLERVPATSVKYIGVPRSAFFDVFTAAVKIRSRQPTVQHTVYDISIQINTELDNSIVSALIAALRLRPVDKTPPVIALQNEITADAKNAEDGFCAALDRRGLFFLRENEQRGEGVVTPDVRFIQPTLICGHLCSWLEYKNYFGFRKNPFVAERNKIQLQKYATQIGPGAVVYALGFETDHFDTDSVMAFREKEVLQDVRTKCCNELRKGSHESLKRKRPENDEPCRP